jgi:hypothetical protein
MDDLVKALIVPFVAAFIVQRFLDILDPLTSKLIQDANVKKIVLGLASLGIGWILAGFLTLQLFHLLVKPETSLPGWLDEFFTGIFISAGTEGFNSLLKFANYKKEASKADASAKRGQVTAEQLRLVNP